MFTVHYTGQLKGGKDILETTDTHANTPLIRPNVDKTGLPDNI